MTCLRTPSHLGWLLAASNWFVFTGWQRSSFCTLKRRKAIASPIRQQRRTAEDVSACDAASELDLPHPDTPPTSVASMASGSDCHSSTSLLQMSWPLGHQRLGLFWLDTTPRSADPTKTSSVSESGRSEVDLRPTLPPKVPTFFSRKENQACF